MYILTCIHDIKANNYFGVHESRTSVDAIRDFERVMKDKRNIYNQYLNDFHLVSLGEFDTEIGQLDLFESKQILARGSDYASEYSPEDSA